MINNLLSQRPASNQLYSRLIKQLQDLNVPELTTLTEVKHLLDLRFKIKIIIDSIFGFSLNHQFVNHLKI